MQTTCRRCEIRWTHPRNPAVASTMASLVLGECELSVIIIGRNAADRPDKQLPRGIEAAFFQFAIPGDDRHITAI